MPLHPGSHLEYVSPLRWSFWTGETWLVVVPYLFPLGSRGFIQLLALHGSEFSVCFPRIGGSTDPPGDSVGAKKVHQVTSELEARMREGAWVPGWEKGYGSQLYVSDSLCHLT